jgi:hypothetical protein
MEIFGRERAHPIETFCKITKTVPEQFGTVF